MIDARDLRDFLKGIFKDAILSIAKEHLSGSKAYITGENEADYRPKDELRLIQSRVESKAEEMATDFLDEIEARGIMSASDYVSKQQTVKDTVESYQNKFIKWLRSQ